MRTYKYIRFPELRRQYRSRKKLLRRIRSFMITAVFCLGYGIAVGLMLTGLWFAF